MVIVVHDSFKENDKSPEHSFIQKLIVKCSLNHPQDNFYIIGLNHENEGHSVNLKFIEVKEPLLPFLRKKRYDKKIRKVLTEISPDLLISTDEYYCRNTHVPQILILDGKMERKDYSETDLKAAKSLIVLNESIKALLISRFQIDPNKIRNIHFGITEEIQPLNFEEQFIVKEDHTDGKEYFLAPHPRDNEILIVLLKAFSIFKKRQQTNMMLVIIANNREITDSFNNTLQNYKYRKDIVLKYRDESQQSYHLLGAAYAFIDPSAESLIPIAEAMKSNVPVLTSEKANELTGSAALYMGSYDHEKMAEQMMLIYKDENLRNELIRKAALIASDYTWKRTMELFWKAIKSEI